MLTRTLTWAGTLLVSGLCSVALAAPPKTVTKNDSTSKDAKKERTLDDRLPARPLSNYRMRAERTVRPVVTKLSKERAYEEGTLLRAEDGVLIYSVQVPQQLREMRAQLKKIPLNKVPTEDIKGLRYNAADISPSMIKNRIGKQVRFEIRSESRDGRFQFCTNMMAPTKKADIRR